MSSGLVQPFVGQLFDRTGSRRVILTGLLLLGVSTILLSLTFHILFLVFMFGFIASMAQSGPGLSNTGALISR